MDLRKWRATHADDPTNERQVAAALEEVMALEPAVWTPAVRLDDVLRLVQLYSLLVEQFSLRRRADRADFFAARLTQLLSLRHVDEALQRGDADRQAAEAARRAAGSYRRNELNDNVVTLTLRLQEKTIQEKLEARRIRALSRKLQLSRSALRTAAASEDSHNASLSEAAPAPRKLLPDAAASNDDTEQSALA